MKTDLRDALDKARETRRLHRDAERKRLQAAEIRALGESRGQRRGDSHQTPKRPLYGARATIARLVVALLSKITNRADE